MKENDNEITFIWKIISDNFMKKYKLLLKITFSLTFSLWKTNVNVHWAPPHHLHIWHSSLQLRLWPQLSHVIIAGLVCWYIPRMMGKTVFLGEFASNFCNRFEYKIVGLQEKNEMFQILFFRLNINRIGKYFMNCYQDSL